MVLAMATKRSRNTRFKTPTELKEPIKWPGPKPLKISRGLLESEEDFAEREASHKAAVAKARERVLWEKVRRVGILAAKMNIDLNNKNALMDFCIALSEALCPTGFSVNFQEKGPGRHKRWTNETYCELIVSAVPTPPSDRVCNRRMC